MADQEDVLNQQHLCTMFSSKFSGINRLEMSPFLAVMRSLKVEFGQTQPEVFKMLLSVLHDYNPCLGQAHFEMTVRYISLLLERHPEFADYIISVLPPVPGTATALHSLHILSDDVTTMKNDVMAGRHDFTAPREPCSINGHCDQEMHPAAKRMRVKDSSIKFYNYTPPSVNAYVASQGIPQRIISNKPQSVAIPAMVPLAMSSTQVGLIPSVAPSISAASTIASPFIPYIPSGGGVLLRPLGAGESVAGLRFGTPSRVVGSHCQTALLLSTRCPTLVTPRSSQVSLASIVNQNKVSASGFTPKPTPEMRLSSSQTAAKASVITHMGAVTPVNTSVTVAISRPSSLKFRASSLERNTASFPYSQQIVVNKLANVKRMSAGEPESRGCGSEKIPAAIDAQKLAATSSDAQTSGKVVMALNRNLVPVPTFTAYHSLCYPGSQPANEMGAGASGEPDLRRKPGGVNIPELAGSLPVAPLDLSLAPKTHDARTKMAAKQAVNHWDEGDLEFSASEPNSQEDCDSQGTDVISVGVNSPVTATMTTADELSSEDPESDTFLAQILKLPAPPDYSSSCGAAPTKEKKKPKTRYYTGKRKRPTNQTKPSTSS